MSLDQAGETFEAVVFSGGCVAFAQRRLRRNTV